MKLFQKTAYVALATTSLMTACSETDTLDLSNGQEKAKLVDSTDGVEEKSNKDVEKQDQEKWENLNNGILVRYEDTTLNDISSQEDENLSNVKVEIEVKNIRSDGQFEDLSEVKYVIRNKEAGQEFVGKAVPVSREEFENLSPNSTIAYNVVFKIDNTKNLNKYCLYINSNLDSSSSISWQLKDPIHADSYDKS
ncbi:hypothetical protein L1M59_11390 [Bacillus sp. ET1]|nr:hypothetical protein [Bacillus sp. ET1]